MKNKTFYNKNKQKIVKKYENNAEEFLTLQNKCYLCGEDLDTYVENLPNSHIIIEKAQCQNCMTVVRVKNHPLH